MNEFDNSNKDFESRLNHGMYFRINGKIINCKGANVVPMSQLEGSLSDRAHEILVESAEAAHMNMLRVWGGGMILPTSFYEACDQKGILIYHDLMFVEEQFHSPRITEQIEEEIKFIVRSLISHPSIVIWNGCNECERGTNVTIDVYSDFVMKTVAKIDDTKPVWPSSPSKLSWKTGVDVNTGLPNGHPFSYWPSGSGRGRSIEKHGPYMHGSTIEQITTVNGHPDE